MRVRWKWLSGGTRSYVNKKHGIDMQLWPTYTDQKHNGVVRVRYTDGWEMEKFLKGLSERAIKAQLVDTMYRMLSLRDAIAEAQR